MWYSVDFTKKKDHNLYDKTFKNLFEEFYFTNHVCIPQRLLKMNSSIVKHIIERFS